MRNGLTELVCILDASGSMHGLEKDVVGGYDSMLEKQGKGDGEVLVTTVLFNQDLTMIHDRLPLEKVPMMRERDYVPSGCTALYDAIGKTVSHIREIHKYAREEDRPEHTIVVITTDGLENASHLYTKSQVREMTMADQKGWEFLFLASNIDAAGEAEGIGISRSQAVQCDNTPEGTCTLYETVGNYVSKVRNGENVK